MTQAMTTELRPDYIVCVKHPSVAKTWCGSPLVGFYLQGLDHAASLGTTRFLACQTCMAAATEVLRACTASAGYAW